MSVYSQERYYMLPKRLVHTIVFVILLSVVLNGVVIFLNCSLTKSTTTPHFFSNERPARLPIDPRPVALEVIDAEDSDRYGMHDDNDWTSVTPLGHGFVKIGDNEDDYYAISMYHQYHCLNDFRKMLSGRDRNASRIEHDQRHAIHCLAYLRQMILCSADITLEPAFSAQNTDGRKTKAAYGAGVTHQCRDWVQIRDFAEANFQLWKDETTGFAASETDVID